LEGCSRAVNVVSSPNRVIPHPLIERSGNHPTGAHQCAGQTGAPQDRHCSVSGAPPRHPTVRVWSEVDRWSLVLLRHRPVRCHTGQTGAPLTSCSDFCRDTVLHYSFVRVDRCTQIAVALLAHRTVRWNTGRSGEL
jgi:hypothetical protein